MVPEGWKLRTINDVGSVITGSTPKTSDRTLYDGPIPFVSPADLGTGRPVTSTTKTLTEKGFEATRKIRKGSTLFTCIGSTIGKIGLAGVDLATNQQINSVVPNSNHDDAFIYYALALRARHIAMLAGKQAVPIINKSMFSDQPILTPPIPEQKKIAQILSTWDQAITATERLLENSQQRKKGLMQQLLTGKKRLPGFEEEWTEGHLGDLCGFKGGSGFKEVYQGNQSGDLPFIKVSDMNLPGNEVYIKNANNWVSHSDAKAMKAKAFLKGSIVFAKVGAALLLNRRRILIRETIIDNNMLAALPNEKASGDYLYQVLLMIDFAKFVQDGAVPSINQSDLSSFKIKYPELEEQKLIARILYTADQEVARIKNLLAHIKQEKKALMQQLLTGKRRVQVEAA